MAKLEGLQDRIRKLSDLVLEYTPDRVPQNMNGYDFGLEGFSQATLTLAVYKEPSLPEFAREQATFMMYLGEHVCPKILSINATGFVMEYLCQPVLGVESIRMQELFLTANVWNRSLYDAPYAKQTGDDSWRQELSTTIDVKIPDWAMDLPSLIHGDPTLDNTLLTKGHNIRITDPIPPHRLIRPSIRAIDHGKMLQSLLGWEVVLRGIPRIEYNFPEFMWNYTTAKRAVFWAMVSLKRIALRNNACQAGQWAERLAEELEKCEL